MSSTNDREGLIKKAAIAIRDAWALRGGVRGADVAARAAVAVFEKAHTPTVIERHDLVMPIYGEPEPQGELPEVEADPDTAFDLGRVAGYDEAMREVEQGEPSDAQVKAALDAFRPWLDSSLDLHRAIDRRLMRAALRAAGEVK